MKPMIANPLPDHMVLILFHGEKVSKKPETSQTSPPLQSRGPTRARSFHLQRAFETNSIALEAPLKHLMLNKHALPFIIAAIASSIIIGFGIVGAFDIYGGVELTPYFLAKIPGVIAPGILFSAALWYRFKSEVETKRYALSGLYMFLLWIALFSISFTPFFVFATPISCCVGIFVIWWTMKLRHGIQPQTNSWISSLFGLIPAVLGFAPLLFAEGIEVMPYYGAATVFVWQLVVGYIYLNPHIEMDEALVQKIDELGT
ncbi:MAG: hypothetical protein AB8F95_18335 [Bacteroidia bacterium]